MVNCKLDNIEAISFFSDRLSTINLTENNIINFSSLRKNKGPLCRLEIMDNPFAAQNNVLSRIRLSPSRSFDKKIIIAVNHVQIKLGKEMALQNVNFLAKMEGLNRRVDVVKWEFKKGAKMIIFPRFSVRPGQW